MWGGRLKGKTDPGFAAFNDAFRLDRRMFAVDVTSSIAYSQALENAKVISDEEGASIRSGLKDILERGCPDDAPVEDIHSFVESRLVELIGDAGRKLHTGR